MKTRSLALLISALVIMFASMISVPAQTKKVNVNFKPGTSGGTYNNTVTGYATVDFYLKAKGGQTMTVKLTSRNTFLYFVVLTGSGDGDAIADDARVLTTWSGQLPADDTYVIRVYLIRAEARRNRRPVSFSLRLDIK